MNSKKRIFSPIGLVLGIAAVSMITSIASAGVARAEAPTTVSYPDTSLILDTDLDGLTDEGEKQRFGTDPKRVDTDGDGWYDGTEAIRGADPLDAANPSANTIVTVSPRSPEATPWAWYVTRGSGLVAFAFAYLAIFLGIAIRLPVLNRLLSPVYSLSVHHSLGFQTLFFSALHGASFLFDTHFKPSFADVFVPFWIESMDPFPLALGILAFYGFVAIVLTSWIKPMIPNRLWRITHFLNVFVYVAVIAHALLLGTDLRVSLFRSLFISANAFLLFLLLANFALKLKGVIARFRSDPAAPNGNIPLENS